MIFAAGLGRAVLLDRHVRGAARARDPRRGDLERHEGRRRLHGRPARGPDARAGSSTIEYMDVLRRAATRSWTPPRSRSAWRTSLPIVVFDFRERGEHPARASPASRSAPWSTEAVAMTVEPALEEGAEKMEKAIAHLKEDLAGVRTGRADSGAAAPRDGRVLRARRSAQPAGLLLGARAAAPDDLAVRQDVDRRDREGDPVERPRDAPRRTTAT